MLYRLNSCTQTELRNIMAFQRQVLEFACDINIANPITKNDIDTKFGNNADWLWDKFHDENNNKNNIYGNIGNLNVIVKTTPVLATQILNVYDHDCLFDRHINNGAYIFQFSTLPVAVKGSLKPLLIEFYLILSKASFPATVSKSVRYRRRDFVKDFWKKNPQINVCPACDGMKPDEVNENVSSDADHYLPKSEYPCISVHPLNLVPTCIQCNRIYKLSEDPIETPLVAPLLEICLPYFREGFGPMVVDISRNATGDWNVSFSENAVANTTKINSINRVYKLQKRWTGRMKTIPGEIYEHISSSRNLWKRYKFQRIDIENSLKAQKDNYSKKRGQAPNYILYYSYLEYTLTNAAEFHTLTN